jgi:hypothetical protein
MSALPHISRPKENDRGHSRSSELPKKRIGFTGNYFTKRGRWRGKEPRLSLQKDTGDILMIFKKRGDFRRKNAIFGV